MAEDLTFPEMDEEPTPPPGGVDDNDKLMAALSYPIPIVAIVILLAEDMKARPFQKFHAVQALAANVALYREAAQEAGHPPQKTMPVMRTVFISDQAGAVRSVRERLSSSGRHRRPQPVAPVDQWAIIGDRHYVRDRLEEYRDRLAITHLIGGGLLPPIEEGLLLRSHQWLVEMGNAGD